MSAKGPDLDLTGRGELSAPGGQRVLRLDQVSGSAFRIPVSLAEPATMQLDAAGGPSTRAALSIGSGRVVVEGKASAPLDLRVTMNAVPASVANGFAPNLGAAGTVSGSATITGETSAPRIRWQADWSGMQVASTRNAGLPPLSLRANGDATRSNTSLQGTLTGAGMTLNLGGSAPFTGNGLNVTVTGRAPLALLALNANRELRLNGSADLDLRVTGSSRAPAVNGSINLVDATAVDVGSGFGIAGASGRVSLNGRQATIDRITGRLAQGGQVSITGSADIGSPQIPGRLSIEVREGRYNDGRVINTTFNANLALNGPLTGGATLSGNVALGRTEIRLPDRLGGNAAAIDVTHINTGPNFTPPIRPQPPASAQHAGRGTLRLDIDLRNTGGIFVRGFGVDSEFGGQLKLTNTIANPTAAGAFHMVRGRIVVLGRRFELTSGLLTFSGDLTPVVAFVATTSTTGTTIQVSVTGRADDPVIAFSSTPEMPDEEILSRLLFDRQVGSLSAVQAAQLVDAAAQLSGVAGGRGIFASVREALGVDDLDIRQNESGGTVVGIGKRINDNIRLGVEAGSDSDSGRVTIDLDLTQELKLRGGAGQGGSGELGLSYEREY
jgi:translocation and assembly module TamB